MVTFEEIDEEVNKIGEEVSGLILKIDAFIDANPDLEDDDKIFEHREDMYYAIGYFPIGKFSQLFFNFI